MSNPNQPPGYPPYGPPPTVIVNQRKSGCGTAAIILLILFIIGSIVAAMFAFGLFAAMFA